MKEMKHLHALLDLAVEQKVFGTKARSFIKHANVNGIKVRSIYSNLFIYYQTHQNKFNQILYFISGECRAAIHCGKDSYDS